MASTPATTGTLDAAPTSGADHRGPRDPASTTGYFRESDDGPLHGAQSAAASVISPVQEVATRAVEPFRDAWGWASSLKDARDRAAALQTEVDRLRGEAVFSAVQAQRLTELEQARRPGAGRRPRPWAATRPGQPHRPLGVPLWRSARAGIAADGAAHRRSSPAASRALRWWTSSPTSCQLGGRREHHRRAGGGPYPGRRPLLRAASSITPPAADAGHPPQRWSRPAVVHRRLRREGLESPYPPGLPVGSTMAPERPTPTRPSR
jgi:hypothetical protein